MPVTTDAAGHSSLLLGWSAVKSCQLFLASSELLSLQRAVVSEFGMNGMKIPLSPAKFDLQAWTGSSLIFVGGKSYRSHLKNKS